MADKADKIGGVLAESLVSSEERLYLSPKSFFLTKGAP